MCFRFLPAGQLVCSTDPQAIILRVQNRKIVPHVTPAGQKSVLILSSYMATHNTTSSEERVNSGSYMGTCEGTWSYHLVFFVWYFFEKGSQMDLAGGYSHRATENGTPLFRPKKLIVKSSLMWQ